MKACTKLYLVRHGEATTALENPERPLSERGRREIEPVAAWAARAGLKVHRPLHSGKLRAAQTAEILAAQLAPEGGIASSPGLAPNDDVYPLARMAQHETDWLMVVSHPPFLSHPASLLLIRSPDRPLILFPTGATVCLVREETQPAVARVVRPESAIED